MYDRLGNPLAIGQEAIDVVADPMQIADPRGEARIAAKVLGLPFRPLYRQLSDRSRGFVYVQRKAPPKLAAALEKRHLVGFTFAPDQKRVYPQQTVAASVLGYAGTDNTGLSGLELQLNKQLEGTPGTAVFRVCSGCSRSLAAQIGSSGRMRWNSRWSRHSPSMWRKRGA